MVSAMALHERVLYTLLGLHLRVAPNLYQEQLSWPGKIFVAKHGAQDGYALSVREYRAGATPTGSRVKHLPEVDLSGGRE